MTTLPLDTKIIMIRHGESEGNAQHIMQGQGDYPLTEKGIEQALVAKPVVDSWLINYWIASDLSRALDTAKILSSPQQVAVDSRLRERGAGPWTGLPRSVLEEAYPGALEDDSAREGLDFEAVDSLIGRTMESLTEVVKNSGRILIVGHGATMRFLDRHLGGDGTRFKNLNGLALSSGLTLLGRVSTKAESTITPKERTE